MPTILLLAGFPNESSPSTKLGLINDPVMPDRTQWANKLAYTEWWPNEIKKGLPWIRIKKRLEEKYLK